MADACAKAVATPYFDLHVTTEATENGKQSDYAYDANVSVAGRNAHMRLQGFISKPEHAEVILVDGMAYSRDVGAPWRVDPLNPETPTILDTFVGALPTATGWSICPVLEEAMKVGDEVVQGMTTTHYTASDSFKALPDGTKERLITTQWDYWVDETGLLVQLRRVETRPPHSQLPVTFITTQTTIISGVGEPNSITAPTVGEGTSQGASEQIVADACAKAVSTDYFDLTVSMKSTSLIVNEDRNQIEAYFDASLSVAGNDYQVELQGLMASPIDGHGIYVDGVGYSRAESTEEWKLEDSLTPTLLSYLGATLTEDVWSICPDSENAEKVGPSYVRGMNTTLYSWRFSRDDSPDSEPLNYTTYQWDFWVDETGQLVQLERTETYRGLDGRPTSASKWTTIISGVGEPNTITSPVLGE